MQRIVLIRKKADKVEAIRLADNTFGKGKYRIEVSRNPEVKRKKPGYEMAAIYSSVRSCGYLAIPVSPEDSGDRGDMHAGDNMFFNGQRRR